MNTQLPVAGYRLPAVKERQAGASPLRGKTQRGDIIRLHLQEHDGKERMFADFPYNKEVIRVIKEIPGAQWSNSKKQWHFAPTNQVYLLLIEKVNGLAVIDSSALKKQAAEKKESGIKYPDLHHATVLQLETFRKFMEQKRYSKQTIIGYLNHLRQFFTFCLPADHANITDKDVERFNRNKIV